MFTNKKREDINHLFVLFPSMSLKHLKPQPRTMCLSALSNTNCKRPHKTYHTLAAFIACVPLQFVLLAIRCVLKHGTTVRLNV